MRLGLREGLIAHQPPLRFGDMVSFLDRGARLRKFGAQRLMRTETADGDLDHGTNPGRCEPFHNIGGDAGLKRSLDLLGCAALGEENHGARLIPVEGAHGFQRIPGGIIKIADDDVGVAGAHELGQADNIGRNRHDTAPGGLKPQAHGFRAIRFAIDQQNTQRSSPPSEPRWQVSRHDHMPDCTVGRKMPVKAHVRASVST